MSESRRTKSGADESGRTLTQNIGSIKKVADVIAEITSAVTFKRR
jgi:hypothetical protein